MNKAGESLGSWGLTCFLLPFPCTFSDALSCQVVTWLPADRLVGDTLERGSSSGGTGLRERPECGPESRQPLTYLLKYSTSRSVSSISTPSMSLGRNTSSRKTQPGGLSAHSQASRGHALGEALPTHKDCPPPCGLAG